MKSAADDVISAGEDAVFTITVTNSGAGDAFDVVITDQLPGDIAWVEDPDTLCTISATQFLECDVGTLAAGASFSVTVRGTTDAPDCGALENTATVDASNDDPVSSSATITVQCPDLVIVKTTDTPIINAGDEARFTITVTNVGDGAAFDVVIDDVLPAGVAWAESPDLDACAITDGVLHCDVGTLPAGESFSVTVAGQTDGGDCAGLENTATAGASNEAQGDTGNNSASASITVQCPNSLLEKAVRKIDEPGLGLHKDASASAVGPGGELTYTLAYFNDGDLEIASATITEQIPDGTEFVACSDDCTVDGSTVTWTVGPIAAGTSASDPAGTVTLTVRALAVNEACQVCNVATIASADFQGGAAVESNEVCTDFVPAADPSGANASGGALGLHVDEQLLDLIDITQSTAASAQSGVGADGDTDQLTEVVVPDIVEAHLIRATANSAVTADPAGARQQSVAEVLDLNVLDGLVTAGLVRAVAEADASGTGAGFSAAGSTFEGLQINGVPYDNVQPNTRVDLPEALFGPGSYVLLFEQVGATGVPSGTSGGAYSADLRTTMIRIHIEDVLVLTGASIDIVVSEATAHADFPQTQLCGAPDVAQVSGHAFVASVLTDPSIIPILEGLSEIPASGGRAEQELASLSLPDSEAVVQGAAARSESAGETDGPPSAASDAEAADVCVVDGPTGCAVRAKAVRADVSASADAGGASASGSTTLVGLTVGSTDVCALLGLEDTCTPPPNTLIELPAGLGFVILNEQIADAAAPGHAGLTVRAIHAVVLTGILDADIIVAEAHADATFLDAAAAGGIGVRAAGDEYFVDITADPGNLVEYRLTYTNNGTGPANDVVITDDVPLFSTFVSCTDSCVVSGDGSPGTILTWSLGTVGAGESRVVYFTVRLDATFPAGETVIVNNATADTREEPEPAAVSNDTFVHVFAAPDLDVTKDASATEARPGDEVTYTIVASNTGNADATGATLEDPIPAGTEFVACSDNCSVTEGVARWDLGTLAAGESVSVTLTVRVLESVQPCQICNVATVDTDQGSASSGEACFAFLPEDHPEGANASGSALGLRLEQTVLPPISPLVIGEASSSQSGVGAASDDDALLDQTILAGRGLESRVRLVGAHTDSSVASDPARAQQRSVAEVADVNLLDGLVVAHLVRGVANTDATGGSASFTAAGSTFEDLWVNGVRYDDVAPNTRVDLPEEVFGVGSFVLLNGQDGSTGVPAGASGGTYTADLTVTMIHVHVTNVLGLLTPDVLDLVVAQAQAHADFPQTQVCGAQGGSVSGHAFVASESTDPSLAPILAGFAAIPASGGQAGQEVANVALPEDASVATVDAGRTDVRGAAAPSGSAASSFAEASDVCLLPSADGVCGIRAKVVRTDATALASGSGAAASGATVLVGLTIDGIDVCDTLGLEDICAPSPNTAITLPAGLGFVVLNEQVPDAEAPGHAGLTVRAIHVVLTTGVLDADIVVAESHADATA
ncbi:MAG TPA: choice-of-anchor P family protein [Candidatus Thermoplasmatota archaeon]|nr:choice-of-anchor P family protein [Candidatus Thermoplasmatota archaeon]